MTPWELPLLLLLAAVPVQAQDSYFVTFPKKFNRGSSFDVNIDILKENVTVPVEVSLDNYVFSYVTYRYEVNTLQNSSGNFSKGETGKLSLPIPTNAECNYCRFTVRGRGALQFETYGDVFLNRETVSVFIQTDKAIYKPSQTVLYRILGVYQNLKLYKGKFNLEIIDPNQNRIKALQRLEASSGVVEGSFDLSDQTLFGTWTLSVTLENITDTGTQAFEVSDYDLPKFEVTVELPPYALVDDQVLSGKVKAKYTFGQPVSGMVELHLGQDILLKPDACGGSSVSTTQISFEINGEASFSVPKGDILRAVYIYDRRVVRVTAFVTEKTTGVRLNGTSAVRYYQDQFQVRFLDKTPSVFKPGLPYTIFIQVSSPDKLPPPAGNNIVSVYTYVEYYETVPDQNLYGVTSFYGSYPLPGQNLTLPASGILSININIPKDAKRINIKVTFGSVSATTTADKAFSKSLNYMQLSLLDKNIKSGDDVRVRVEGTEPLGKLTYEILSRGLVVSTGSIDGNGNTSFTFTLRVTTSMAPTAYLVVYYGRNNDEIVADSLVFNVDGFFNNKVSIGFSTNETQPGLNVSVVVSADPDSQAHILAVDQSVLLLKTSNDITADQVRNILSTYNAGDTPTDSESALSSSATTIIDMFSNIGLGILTDLSLYNTEPVYYYRPYNPYYYNPYDDYNPYFADNTYKAPVNEYELQSVDRIRQYFPETWLWSTRKTRSNGKAIIQVIVPDTITSWVASAFATNLVTGLGVAPTTSLLRVFKSFFVSLNYPRSVVRNEQFVVIATIFNYLGQDLTVKVTLKNQTQFNSLRIYPNGTERLLSGNQEIFVLVKSNTQEVAYFPILATSLGLVDIEVTAQTTIAADGVRRQILFKPEGAPVNYNVPVFININNTSLLKYERNISFTLPVSVVGGSEKVRVKATGDLIGSSLSSLTSLVTLPVGCGEQVMVKFAPNLYIAKYLKATGQLSASLRTTILEALEAGYQRQITYQRYDGGFSPFGSYDTSGSTWLTALTARIFLEARAFIFIDPYMIQKAIRWILNRQNLDGSFNEFGKILDRNTQGAGTGPSLTAFVLLSLLEARDVFFKPCNESYSCYDYYLWGNVTKKARTNLESLITNNTINEQFSLAIVSYALSKAKSPIAKTALDKLLTFSKTEGNILYWQAYSSDSAATQSKYTIWEPPRIQARPVDILITSYAVLTFLEKGRIESALPAVRWLTTQRNAQGGFSSTQDTVVGLQALSAYATKFLKPNTQLNIKVAGPTVLAEFNVTKANELSLQIKELIGAPTDVTISAVGNGIALVDIDYSFNVNAELTTPAFEVGILISDDRLDTFNLLICTKWLLKRESGMVVQEISIPSGFSPDLSSLGSVAGLKRSERQGDVVAIYFDQIGITSICYSLRMLRESNVAKSQRNYVRTFDYYDPDDQSTVFYQPKAIRDATICDICDECCPRP